MEKIILCYCCLFEFDGLVIQKAGHRRRIPILLEDLLHMLGELRVEKKIEAEQEVRDFIGLLLFTATSAAAILKATNFLKSDKVSAYFQ